MTCRFYINANKIYIKSSKFTRNKVWHERINFVDNTAELAKYKLT